ncbi:hypothetical protein C0992_007292 [Termitomyces sp. T32_za158]|nr:hypothetical protein C0992_007292 [Termitomyces sp. T32_za158]
MAQEWEFPEVLELAIRELSKIEIPLIRRIGIYQDLRLDQKYLLPFYAKLCTRKQGLNQQEAAVIGLETTVTVFLARERLRDQLSNGATSLQFAGFKDSDVMAALMAALVATPRKVPNSE